MDSQLQSISKIFTEKLFRIPDYQRGYAWTEKQLKDYWNDIVQLESNKNHYVGVLTLERVPNEVYETWQDDNWIIKSKNFEPYYIVDGQQRLTTTIILLQAITESVKDTAVLNYTTTDEIKKRYIFDSRDGGISRSYIFGYEKDNPSYEFLKKNIFLENSTSGYSNEVTIYTHNLDFAKEYFSQRLKKLKLAALEDIFKKVTQHLLFNIYSISSDIDVFIAFETMNNRGKPLSNLELLKNRLIYLSTKFPIDDTDKAKLRKIINDGWKGVYHYLGKNKEVPLVDDVFLSNHAYIFFGNELIQNLNRTIITIDGHIRSRLTSDRNIGYYLLETIFTYKRVLGPKNKLTTNQIKNYVENLQEAVVIWYNIHNPTLCMEYSEEERLLLDRINRLGGKRISPIVMAVYLKKPNLELKIKVLKSLERYTFVNLLERTRINFLHDFASSGASILKGKLPISKFITALNLEVKEILETKEFTERISENFKDYNFYRWAGIRYFLFEYENSLRDKSKTKKTKLYWHDYDVDVENFVTIEHIYPQTAKDDTWKKSFASFSAKEKKYLVNSLGNLLPLSKPKNSSLQNKPFLFKVDNGSNSIGYRYGSYSENEISGLEEWTHKDILNRGLKLIKFMEQNWSLDFKTDEKRMEILGLSFLNTKK